ncbi:MAG: hypothetical protein CRN43_00770 [Candidatus Nephrothrix sp. EaCA]|nr:MAG: hypothetical protein CRN43_00770 [Candidatus Nephrothrix sp. EaCA]
MGKASRPPALFLWVMVLEKTGRRSFLFQKAKKRVGQKAFVLKVSSFSFLFFAYCKAIFLA